MIRERMAVRRAVEHARKTNPLLTLLARTHTGADRAYLERHGVAEAVFGETELALELGRRALERFDLQPDEVEQLVAAARRGFASEPANGQTAPL